MTQINSQSNPLAVPTLLQMMGGCQTTQIIHILSALRIPDLIEEGYNTIDTITKQLEGLGQTVIAEDLSRILRAAGSLGLINISTDNIYSLTDLSLPLTTNHPHSLRHYSMVFGTETYFACGKLLEGIKSGKSAFSHYYGETFFEYLPKNPVGKLFKGAMKNLSTILKDPIVDCILTNVIHECDDKKLTIIDLGGGEGNLLKSLVGKTSNCQGIVLDTLDVAHKSHIENGETERVEYICGSFFDDEIPSADVYIIMQSLHNWGDEQCKKVLDNVRNSIQRGTNRDAKLLLIERIMPDETRQDLGSTQATLMDITMLVLCEGGKERTKDQFSSLLQSSHFKRPNVYPVHKTPVFVIESTLNGE